MPVPVPFFSKPISHPVIKCNQPGATDHLKFQHLTHTLPLPPTGPPPAFGTREEWIRSLPSWRRSKPRMTWDMSQDEEYGERHFYAGLMDADNASVIKGTRAQACIPPLGSPLQLSGSTHADRFDGDADDELSSESSLMDRSPYGNGSQWTASSPFDQSPLHDNDLDMEQRSQANATYHSMDYSDDELAYDRGAFTPVFEDEDSPAEHNVDMSSSPIGPLTPFGEFVDRAIAAQPTRDTYVQAGSEYLREENCGECHQEQIPRPIDSPVPDHVVTPSASDMYKKLADPLSQWVANYVWKVCTTGMSLPAEFSHSMYSPSAQYPQSPPSFLPSAIQSLLLSTLLQPSAVFLAIWYIVRLPVYFDAAPLNAHEYAKEIRFRAELLGDGHIERDILEGSAPFRLVLLGCMLANKWLDDHTFSNKTWHTISNVPVHSVNRLEALALDIFSYDLSVPAHAWSQWLAHVESYHASLSSPARPQPIGRPSANPHMVVRKAIDELVRAPIVGSPQHSLDGCPSGSSPEPVFLGLEERRRDKQEAESQHILEIDLDEDGPLRQEYLPKRRVSGANSIRSTQPTSRSSEHVAQRSEYERRSSFEMEKSLPPPAKWSPAGDEPILRDRNRGSGHYVAVQPQPSSRSANGPWDREPLAYRQAERPVFYPVFKQENIVPVHNFNSVLPPQEYGHYFCVAPVQQTRLRSHSVMHEQENMHPRGHSRSYSQTRFDYRTTDYAVHDSVAPAVHDLQWSAFAHYGYPAPYAFHLPTAPAIVSYQSPWL